MIRTRQEPTKRRTLDDLFAESDEYGLLNVVPKRAAAATADQRLLSSLKKVEAFVTQHGHAPDPKADDLTEASLAVQLTALRENPEHAAALAEYDALGLLNVAVSVVDDATKTSAQQNTSLASAQATTPERTAKTAPDAVMTLTDIWDSDVLGLLSEDEEAASIFNITHVPDSSDRDKPDEIAQRNHVSANKSAPTSRLAYCTH
jgi:hypothetical protein